MLAALGTKKGFCLAQDSIDGVGERCEGCRPYSITYLWYDGQSCQEVTKESPFEDIEGGYQPRLHHHQPFEVIDSNETCGYSHKKVCQEDPSCTRQSTFQETGLSVCYHAYAEF